MKKEIIAFFDRLEERLENNIENKNRMKKGMGFYTRRAVAGAFGGVGVDLLFLISFITGFELYDDLPCFVAVVAILLVANEICCRRLDRLIMSQENEELAEDLEDDIHKIAIIVVVAAFVVPALTALAYTCVFGGD